MESNKKRARYEKRKRDWIGSSLLGANFELSGRNDELDRAWHVVQDLEKTLGLYNLAKKNAQSDYEA